MAIVLLMQHGADPNFLDAEGLTCVHIAAQFGHTAVLAYMIAKGVDVNAQDVNGLTPLMYCALKHMR
jgi:palmitoyltransferase